MFWCICRMIRPSGFCVNINLCDHRLQNSALLNNKDRLSLSAHARSNLPHNNGPVPISVNVSSIRIRKSCFRHSDTLIRLIYSSSFSLMLFPNKPIFNSSRFVMVCLSAYEILYHIYKSIEMKINLDLSGRL